jgi:cyclohexyl-isocyanide hydratase
MTQPISVAIPVYNGVTQLDFTGPHQFLSRTPDLNVRVASLGGEPVTADLTFSNLEDLTVIKSCDVLLVPGGGGCINAIENDRFIKEIVRLGATARYLTSVCTGSLILGAAGLITGRRAARHWAWREFLPVFGAIVDEGRIVRDGNILSRGRHRRHRFRVGTDRGVAWITRGRDGSTRLGICASTALRLRAPGHGTGRSAGSG